MSENLHTIPEDLLVKHLLQEASPEEVRQVEAWIGANAANRKYYEHLALIWQQSRKLSKGYTVDEEASWQKFRQRIRQGSTTTTTPPPKITRITAPGARTMAGFLTHRSWRIAALFLLIVTVAGLAWLFSGTSAPALQTLSSLEKTATDTLPDGSIVTLNKHSTLSYPRKLKVSTRTTELQGEAFFRISPDKDRPFFIYTKGITIKVLGTSFNVRNGEGKTGIIVETGLVQVSNQYGAILAGPHEEIELDSTDHVLVKKTVANELYKYYRTREFVCDNTPLGEFVAALNEAYNVHIVIGKPSLLDLRLTTVFHDESLDAILSIIGKTFEISVTKAADRIILQ
ncbi:MAG TPA: FecR domain-containing protein [Puia sp.]|nr:FecR domain-containing protein [Puia sp.]